MITAPSGIFLSRASDKLQHEAIRETLEAFPGAFADARAAAGFLFQIILPPSLRWGFMSVGKNASSSTLNFLYEAEFGHRMSARVKPLDDINPSAAIHMQAEYGVFGRALWLGGSMPGLLGTPQLKERICVVRDPLARAVSGFRYLCKSHQLESRWFARDRARMSAVVGFDWDSHTDTAEGMIRFLHYLDWQISAEGADSLDGHWMPQATFIKPDVFQPTLIGRVEDMTTYYAALHERLGREDAGGQPPIWENRQGSAPDDLLADDVTQRLCERLYAADYDTFGY